MRKLALMALLAIPVKAAAQNACVMSAADTFRLASGGSVFIDQPEMVWLDRELMLISGLTMVYRGTSTSYFDSTGLYTGVRRDSTGALHLLPPIAPLANYMQLVNPRAVSDSNAVHVVWAKTDSASGNAHSLYYDRLVSGRWVSRELIATGRMLRWDNTAQSSLIRVGDTLWFAVADRARGAIALFRRSLGRWSEQRLSQSSTPSYLALGVVPGLMVIGFVDSRPDPGDRSGHGSVSVIRSTDGGATWSSPERLVKSVDTHSHETVILPLGDSALIVAWAQGGIMEHDSVMTALVPRDRPASPGATLHVPRQLRSLRAATAGNGFWVVMRSGDGAPLVAKWANGSWHMVTLSDYTNVILPPRVSVSSAGIVHTIWTEQAPDEESRPHSRSARLINCARQ